MVEITDIETWLLFLLSLIVFAFIGYWILTYYIISDYDINSKCALILFCITFSFSVNSLVLLPFEVWKAGTTSSLALKWKITLNVLAYDTLFILPCIITSQIILKLNYFGKKFKPSKLINNIFIINY